MNQHGEDPFKQFGYGISAATFLITIEFCIFVLSSVKDLLPTITNSLPASSTTPTLYSNFSTLIGIFILIGIIQSLIVGIFGSKPFIFGFLLVVGIFLYVFYVYVLDLIPSVVYGMTTSFLIVLSCLIFRLYFEKPRYDDYRYN
jgi:hypothetical protein